MGEDVLADAGGGKVFQAHPPGLSQLNASVQRQQQGEGVGEAEPPENAAADGGEITQLHPHDVFDALGHGPAGEGGEAFVGLQLPQGHHGPDAPALLRLLDGIEPQAGEVHDGVHIFILQFQPEHAPQGRVALFRPKQVQSLFHRFGAGVVFDGQHSVSSL